MQRTDDVKTAIIARLDVQGVYEEICNVRFEKFQADGWSSKVKCPFHEDQKTPNFAFNRLNGKCKCFACGFSGSIFDAWIQHRGCSFAEAVEQLGQRANLSPEETKYNRESRAAQEIAPVPKPTIKTIEEVQEIDRKRAKYIPLSTVNEMHEALNEAHYKYLNKAMGFTKSTIEKRYIGWCAEAYGKDKETGQVFKGRICFPVLDEAKACRNLRLHSSRCDSKYKIINYVVNKDDPEKEIRYGSPPRLYGLDLLVEEKWDTVVICEGEKDSILLTQELHAMGLKNWGAVSGTAGCTTFDPNWLPYLKGKEVYFCYDCDPEGKTAVDNIVRKHIAPVLSEFAFVKIIHLPLPGSKELKDVSDYLLKAKLTAQDFVVLATESPEIMAGGFEDEGFETPAIEVDSFVRAIKDRSYINQRIRVPISISGSSSKIFHSIRDYTVSRCPLMKEGQCCCQNAGTFTVPDGHTMYIHSCMRTESQNLKQLAAMTCQHGEPCRIEPVRSVVMEEYFAHQVVTRWIAEERGESNVEDHVQELVTTSIYVMQPKTSIKIEPRDYMATGWVRTHPHTSLATFFVEKLEKLSQDWESFSVDDADSREALMEFRDNFTVDEIIEQLTTHVTHIYEADEIIYAVLLTYLTPLWFDFNGSRTRGWINTVVVGDSGTGKSHTYTKIADWLGVGDSFSCLTGTRTGLLWAVKPRGGEWEVKIGKFVYATGRIILVDEAQELPPEEIKKMALAIDTGRLEVEQVASGGYDTMTRLILMMNPKDVNGRSLTMGDFAYGCDALRCFDHMFVRRFSLAIFATGKHRFDFYNRAVKSSSQTSPLRLTPLMLRTLVYWIWTRKPSQILWDTETTTACLDASTRLAEKFGYTTDVPLVNPQDIRKDLARLANAYATLSRSMTDDLHCLVVKPSHVLAMERLLDELYSMPECNLSKKSVDAKLRSTLSDEDFEQITKKFTEIIDHAKTHRNPYFRDRNHFAMLLLLLEQQNVVRRRELAEQVGVSSEWVQARLAVLRGLNMVEFTANGIRKTKKFNSFMLRWRMSDIVRKMLDDTPLEIANASMMSQASSSRAITHHSTEEPSTNEADDPFQ